MTLVRYEEDGLIVRIILNRPQKLNAFNQDIILELTQALSKAEKSMARMVVFQGNGKGFSGGFDLSDIKTSSDGELVLRFIQVEKFLQAVYHCPLATVAFVHGACFGAAADLVAACHWRIATSDARFLMPGPKFGLVLGTRRLSVLVGEDNARQLLLRDKPFDAPDALRTNFISQIKEYDEWMDIEKKNPLSSKANRCKNLCRASMAKAFRSPRFRYDGASQVCKCEFCSISDSNIP